MDNSTELERIYLLKSQGLADVLADINAIKQAFEASAKAKSNLVESKGNILMEIYLILSIIK